MPITYQRLGNSGGGMVDLKITTYPNTLVKLQNEKINKSAMSDESGVVVFKGLKGGVYTATVDRKTKEIVLITEYHEALTEQIKDIKIGSKIKFSSGKKFILMKKDAKADKREPYPLNSACLVSEFIVDTYTMEKPETWVESKAWQEKMSACYEELSQKEKSTILSRIVTNSFSNSSFANLHFYMLSKGEVGTASYDNGYNLGFTDNASRKRTTESGENMGYYLRDQYRDKSNTWRVNLGSVNRNGADFDTGIGGWIAQEDLPKTGGLVLACNISQDAYVALDSDGYYRILGM